MEIGLILFYFIIYFILWCYLISFFIILLNLFSFIQSNKNVIIPLYYTENINKLNYIEFLFQPQLYGKIKLGTPEQIVYLLITTDINYFKINNIVKN